jgi:hypothetical protein
MTYTTVNTPDPVGQPAEEEVLQDSDYLEEAYARMEDNTSDEDEVPADIGSALADTV